MTPKPRLCSGPVARRAFLKAGLFGLGGMLGCEGLGLSDLLRARAAAGTAANNETSCIFVWLVGGQSHLDTYDLKPDAPREFRGEISPIKTRVPGIEISEQMPLQAALADKFALIRSVHHKFPGHVDGAQMVLTGYPPKSVNPLTEHSDYPDLSSIYKAATSPRAGGLPQNVAVRHSLYYAGPSYLGERNNAFVVPTSPHNSREFYLPSLDVPVETMRRLDDRVGLLKSFDRVRSSLDARGTMDSMDTFNGEAVRLLTGKEARQAFDVTREDPKTRDRYGHSLFGRGLLMARRLVEAGVGFVSVDGGWFQDVDPYLADNWDDHEVNRDIWRAHRLRIPPYDQGVSALIEDLHQRGLDKNVLLVVMGEFGRTPQILYANNQPGRGHYPGAMSILLSGGGLSMGQVIGETDARGESPKNRPLDPTDFLATIYRFLGVDTTRSFNNYAGRPIPILPTGEPIRELFA